jgi:hypothetical protein
VAVDTGPQLPRRSAGISTAAGDALFILLIAVSIFRTLRHAMWRDELQAFSIAASSSSLWDLFVKLKHEGHPGLWYVLVWLVTRVTSNPMWMQVLHIGLAIGVWIIICRCSPFSLLEKLLLLLSYFLFWEYFVISRSYVLIALIGFAFIVLRERRPQPQFIPWLLLGLLANVHMSGAIWSMASAATLAIDSVRRRSVPVAGPAVYLGLLLLAIATMVPAGDFAPYGHDAGLNILRFNSDLVVPIGAFVPLSLDSIRDALAFAAHPATAAAPQFWSRDATADFVALTHADTDHPVRLALAFALPIAACWLIVRDRMLVLEFTLVYLGIVLFENIWNFPGGARHHGVVFLALIAAAWSARARHPANRWSVWTLGVLLVVNACGGVLTLASELRPFSDGYSTAAWLKRNNLANAFLIGSRDAQVSSVAGYLGRPVYYLECECAGTFVVWNDKRQSPLSAEQFGQRLTKALALAGQRDAILIRYRPVSADDLRSAPTLSAALLNSFADAWTDEKFWIYRVRETQPP